MAGRLRGFADLLLVNGGLTTQGAPGTQDDQG
jgi:hypothetical protein